MKIFNPQFEIDYDGTQIICNDFTLNIFNENFEYIHSKDILFKYAILKQQFKYVKKLSTNSGMYYFLIDNKGNAYYNGVYIINLAQQNVKKIIGIRAINSENIIFAAIDNTGDVRIYYFLFPANSIGINKKVYKIPKDILYFDTEANDLYCRLRLDTNICIIKFILKDNEQNGHKMFYYRARLQNFVSIFD